MSSNILKLCYNTESFVQASGLIMARMDKRSDLSIEIGEEYFFLRYLSQDRYRFGCKSFDRDRWPYIVMSILDTQTEEPPRLSYWTDEQSYDDLWSVQMTLESQADQVGIDSCGQTIAIVSANGLVTTKRPNDRKLAWFVDSVALRLKALQFVFPYGKKG